MFFYVPQKCGFQVRTSGYLEQLFNVVRGQDIQLRNYPTYTYKGEPIQAVESFRYLDIDVITTYKWCVFMSLHFK